jgi:hypothetical protein
MNWYDDLACSMCGKSLAATRHQGRPLLRDAAGATVEPHRHTALQVAALRETHVPVCWACNLDTAFRGSGAPAKASAPKPPPDASWWEGFPCDVCGKPLRRGWFWQERPRAVGRDSGSIDVRATDLASCSGAGKRFVVSCTDCYRNHYDRVTKAVRALGAPEVAPTG